MNQRDDTTVEPNFEEHAEPDHLLKEYELCWEGVQHHNTRVWSSAAIFISGSILALTWLGSRPLPAGNWTEFSLVALIGLLIALVLLLYLRIFGSWEVLDRVEFYRAEEIEKRLGLWRIRYRISSHEHKPSIEPDARLRRMREVVANRLKVPEKALHSRRGANRAFRCIIYLITFGSFAIVARALAITLGYIN